jgi:hypothetical protein
MTKRLAHPPNIWELVPHADNTLYTYIQAVRLLGE